jgi:hypothetical protein
LGRLHVHGEDDPPRDRAPELDREDPGAAPEIDDALIASKAQVLDDPAGWEVRLAARVLEARDVARRVGRAMAVAVRRGPAGGRLGRRGRARAGREKD